MKFCSAGVESAKHSLGPGQGDRQVQGVLLRRVRGQRKLSCKFISRFRTSQSSQS